MSELPDLTDGQKLNNFRKFSESIDKLWYKIQLTNISNSDDIIKWCFENCTGRFSFHSYTSKRFRFYFKYNNDYTLFVLTWGQ